MLPLSLVLQIPLIVDCSNVNGFSILRGADIEGYNIAKVTSVEAAAALCTDTYYCKAFTNEGWLKNTTSPVTFDNNTNICVYVKDDAGELNVYTGTCTYCACIRNIVFVGVQPPS